ncbi:hypothetical protein [Desulfitobacterium metallireducens]|uniref:Uncharacterized protein n=1 Tax=Desulfitobacterium metallireducens DSM 15288 TaxID=871968 RepID=W0EHB1_9FIRM|nr:hypothetical protein [Desulfitobacterium metallireducens]AHF08599.1 hypothetical protein DESME_09190 [Desulfitobacterium metallireducens DSM 15288]
MKIHKIRNVIIVLGIFGLLSGSLYVNSSTITNKALPRDIQLSSNPLEQTPLPPSESSSSSVAPKATATPSSPSSDSSSSASTSETSVPDSSSPSQQGQTASDLRGENNSIQTQVQNSAHNQLSLQGNGVICNICHSINGNTYSLRNKGWESCGSCHVNSNGNPTPGHEVQHPQFQMIQGTAIGDILPMPSYKYKYMKDTFTCTDCHLTNASKHDFLAPGVSITDTSEGIRHTGTEIDYQAFRAIFNQDKCAVCHPSGADMVERVKIEQETISKRLDELEPIYIEWSGKIASMNPEDPKVIAFKNGATYFTFVDADGSKGVHNFPYAQALLDKAESYWKILKQ